MAPTRSLLVLTTLSNADAAQRLAETLVEAGVAACVNISAPVTSIYRWEGATQRDTEVMLTIKTTENAYPALQSEIRSRHPYELPELIAVPITQGLPEYLDWIRACVDK